MIFDNNDKVTRLNIIRYLSLIVYVVCMGMLLLSGIFTSPIFGISINYIVIIISIIYIVYVIYVYIKNYNFFKFNDEEGKLVFQYVSLRPFDNKKKTIKITKKDFSGYKIKKSILNLKVDLILSVKTKKGVANYPPISITALVKRHKALLINSLNQSVR